MAENPSPLAEALAVWVDLGTAAAAAGVFSVLPDVEVLLPVRPTLVTEQAIALTGLRAEKEAELAVLTVDLGDGRRVLPVFTSPELMRRWRIEARPVRGAVRDTCRAVLDEGWSGLVIDPGTADFVVGPAAVQALAAGFVPVAGSESASVGMVDPSTLVPHIAEEPTLGPALFDELRRGLAREPAVGQAWLLRGGPPVDVGVTLRAPLDAAGLAVVAARLSARVAGGALALTLAALDPQAAAAVSQRCPRLWP